MYRRNSSFVEEDARSLIRLSPCEAGKATEHGGRKLHTLELLRGGGTLFAQAQGGRRSRLMPLGYETYVQIRLGFSQSCRLCVIAVF